MSPIIIPKKWKNQELNYTEHQNNCNIKSEKYEGWFLLLAIVVVVMIGITIKENK